MLRLQTDHIDLYYQHRTDPDIAPEEVAGVMSELMQEGKILHWGLSEMSEEYLRRAHAVCPVTVIQNRYSMMARWHEKLFPVLEELNIGFVAFYRWQMDFCLVNTMHNLFLRKIQTTVQLCRNSKNILTRKIRSF